MLPDFFFCSLFPVQQTTSGIGHRVSSFFGLATNTLNVRNNNNNNNNCLFYRGGDSFDALRAFYAFTVYRQHIYHWIYFLPFTAEKITACFLSSP